MFNPKTQKIKEILQDKKYVIENLESLIAGRVFIYIDYANVRPWANKLKWHISIKRFKQFLDSFNNIEEVKFYQGTLVGDKKSESEIAEIDKRGYILRTKPVKLMRIPIDISSISKDSPAILNHFVRKALLRKFDIETIEFLNEKLEKLNNDGILYIEDRKCNFDVEMGVDMLLDYEKNKADTFILMSGDSDFADPVEKLLNAGKKVILFGTAGRISKELSDLRSRGLIVFDIKKIGKFICWDREIKDLK